MVNFDPHVCISIGTVSANVLIRVSHRFAEEVVVRDDKGASEQLDHGGLRGEKQVREAGAMRCYYTFSSGEKIYLIMR